MFVDIEEDPRYMSTGAVSQDLNLLTAPSQFDTLKSTKTGQSSQSKQSFLDTSYQSFTELVNRPTPSPTLAEQRLNKSASSTLAAGDGVQRSSSRLTEFFRDLFSPQKSPRNEYKVKTSFDDDMTVSNPENVGRPKALKIASWRSNGFKKGKKKRTKMQIQYVKIVFVTQIFGTFVSFCYVACGRVSAMREVKFFVEMEYLSTKNTVLFA